MRRRRGWLSSGGGSPLPIGSNVVRESRRPSRFWVSRITAGTAGHGAFIVWRKTAKKRMIAKLRAIKARLRYRMRDPVALVGAWHQKVVMGYCQYHAVPGNLDRLRIFGQRLRRSVAPGSKSSQSMRHVAIGSVNADLQPQDSYRACSAPLFTGTLHRHSSKVGAVCVNALVRFCAGGDE
jgi:hypothetical protein